MRDPVDIAELDYDTQPISAMDQAATYSDDKLFRAMLLEAVSDRFDKPSKFKQDYSDNIELAMLDILVHYIEHECAPSWIEPLIEKVAKERFGNE